LKPGHKPIADGFDYQETAIGAAEVITALTGIQYAVVQTDIMPDQFAIFRYADVTKDMDVCVKSVTLV